MATPEFTVQLAKTEAEIRAAQSLRYHVFVEELGGRGAMVDHAAGLERDRFDPYFDHLLLLDKNRPENPVIGVYRLMRNEQAEAAGQFYSEDEYDLSVLKSSGHRLLELGRSCLHRDYRGGAAMFYLWQALVEYVAQHRIDVLFGVASFLGTDAARLAQPLSMLHARHLAPLSLRVRARSAQFQPMDLLPPEQIDRKQAMLETPALIKAYLRLGGSVGEGAWIDRDFNTTDVCLVMDTQKINAKSLRIFTNMGDRR